MVYLNLKVWPHIGYRYKSYRLFWLLSEDRITFVTMYPLFESSHVKICSHIGNCNWQRGWAEEEREKIINNYFTSDQLPGMTALNYQVINIFLFARPRDFLFLSRKSLSYSRYPIRGPLALDKITSSPDQKKILSYCLNLNLANLGAA